MMDIISKHSLYMKYYLVLERVYIFGTFCLEKAITCKNLQA